MVFQNSWRFIFLGSNIDLSSPVSLYLQSWYLKEIIIIIELHFFSELSLFSPAVSALNFHPVTRSLYRGTYFYSVYLACLDAPLHVCSSVHRSLPSPPSLLASWHQGAGTSPRCAPSTRRLEKCTWEPHCVGNQGELNHPSAALV